MAEIEVAPAGPDRYRVDVRDEGGGTTHIVCVTADAVNRYAPPGTAIETLLELSFRFLLEREPKESILREFDLPTIERYFPEFAAEIRTRLTSGG